MGYAELIKTLEALPEARRAEIFDFAEFLAARCGIDKQNTRCEEPPPSVAGRCTRPPVERQGRLHRHEA